MSGKHGEKIRALGVKKRKQHRIINGIESRYCAKCVKWKPVVDFYSNKSRWDNLSVYCMQCENEAGMIRRNKCKRNYEFNFRTIKPTRYRIDKYGYKLLNFNSFCISKHRHIMQKHLRRLLKKSEHVHHIYFNKSNNNIKNLELVSGSQHKCITDLKNEIDKLEAFIKKEDLWSSYLKSVEE